MDLPIPTVHIKQRSPTFLAPGTGFMEDNFSMDRGGGNGSGGNANDGERWGASDEASLACPRLTSCCAARFLTDRGPPAVRSLGTPGINGIIQCVISFVWLLSLSIMSSEFNHIVAHVSTSFFYGQIIFYCLHIPHFVYPLISWWTFGGLLWIMVLWTFVHKFLRGCKFSILFVYT